MNNDDDDAIENNDDTYNHNNHYGLSKPEMAALAMVPKFPAFISVIGSSMILREVWLDRIEGSDKPTSRVLVSLSLADLFFSAAWILTTWAAPSDLDYMWGNVGNQATCVLQAFLFQLGMAASGLSNISLMVFYMLIVRHNYSDRKLATIEKPLYFGIWTFSLLCSICPIPLGLYNNAGEVCWFQAYPIGCNDMDDIACERGENAWIPEIVFTVFPAWFAVVAAFVIMWLIYSSVRNVEDRMSQYAGALRTTTTSCASTVQTRGRSNSICSSQLGSSSDHIPRVKNSIHASHDGVDVVDQSQRAITVVVNRSRSEKVAEQAMCYIGALLSCYLVAMVFVIIYAIAGIWYFEVNMIYYFLLPLQGFFNFCIFARTRTMKSGLAKFIKRIVFSCVSVILCRRNDYHNNDDEATTPERAKAATTTTTTATPLQNNTASRIQTCTKSGEDKGAEVVIATI